MDALEALHPGEFEKIVAGHLSAYINRKAISETGSRIAKAQSDTNQTIEDSVGVEFGEEIRELQDEVDDLAERINRAAGVEKPELGLPSLPEIVEKEGWLYDSERDYFDQLKEYKRNERFQDGTFHLKPTSTRDREEGHEKEMNEHGWSGEELFKEENE